MATITGTNSNETKFGTTVADIINGMGGNDTLWGRAGNDTIYGGAGTDKLYGEAGNDTLIGGTGIAHLYGGDGNDSLSYDPTTGNIASVGQYLKSSVLDGGAGYDTLTISNKATYTSGTATKAALTEVYVDDAGKAHISFTKPNAAWDFTGSEAGTITGVESLVVSGAGGLLFTADLYGSGIKNVTGTAAADQFFGGFGSEKFTGGAGNDTFSGGGGNDTFVSTTTDSDRFVFDLEATGKTTIIGFNGAGVAGGDTIVVDSSLLTSPKTQISEYAGKTTFALTDDMSFTVDAVGLKQGVDWFFV